MKSWGPLHLDHHTKHIQLTPQFAQPVVLAKDLLEIRRLSPNAVNFFRAADMRLGCEPDSEGLSISTKAAITGSAP